jgi:hypothetical protein
MKKTVPVAYYKSGQRVIVGEAVVDMDDYDGVNWRTAEININNAGLSEILAPKGEFSLAKARSV